MSDSEGEALISDAHQPSPVHPEEGQLMANAHEARSRGISTPKGATDVLETAVKAGTIVLGALYVVGLLVSNVHLMTLGISDFSSVQARNIMTGFVFALYVALLLAVVLPLVVGVRACRRVLSTSRSPLAKLLGCGSTMALWIGVSCCAGLLAATLLGYMYPWGAQWRAAYALGALTWSYQSSLYQSVFVQFVDSFCHPEIVVASGITVFVASASPTLPTSLSADELSPPLRANLRVLLFASRPWVLLPPVALPLLMVGFARCVYPNMLQNIGGGQPSVAKLQITNEEHAAVKLLRICSSCKVKSDDIFESDPVAIWYLSEKFIYVAPLTTEAQGRAQILAVDIGLVKAIDYLPKAVRVDLGGRILSVYSR